MSEERAQRRMSRRGVLRAGGGLAAGAALAVGYGADRAAAALPTSQRFVLSEPSYDLFRHKPLHNDTVQQSFCFDNVNRRLFVAQVRNSTATEDGDLCVTELDFSGNELGYMYLTGFGHGVSFAAQPVGGDTYLWTETDTNTEGRGVRLARFRWSSGSTLDRTSSALAKHTPVSADAMTCAIDTVNNRMAIRYDATDGGFRMAVFEVADVASGDYGNKLVDVALPTGLGTFQGYTLYGQYAYLLTGDAYSDDNPDGNSTVHSVDLNDGGRLVESFLTGAGSTLTHREPEGMALYRTVAGETRLFLGFASGETGDRRCNIFYKNALVD
ncbi:teichoic acid biosynthesis protein C [Streptomyces sp. B6B3]|uniref:phage baseplate protein n=1 Tax=Streptomyces sp. B6B3 TaxID=3153570 RepID=UPI00325F8CF6